MNATSFFVFLAVSIGLSAICLLFIWRTTIQKFRNRAIAAVLSFASYVLITPVISWLISLNPGLSQKFLESMIQAQDMTSLTFMHFAFAHVVVGLLLTAFCWRST